MLTTSPGTGPTILKETRYGYRAVEVRESWSLRRELRRADRCICPDGEQHAKGCPIHLAWVTSSAAEKGCPELEGVHYTARIVFEAAFEWGWKYLHGVKKSPCTPGREGLAVIVGALRPETRARAQREGGPHAQRGLCALETVSRALNVLKHARDVKTGRKILRVRQQPAGKLAQLLVEPWVFDLPRDARLRVAIPGDFDYPDPAIGPVPQGEPSGVNPDVKTENEYLFDPLRPDELKSAPDLTSPGGWTEDRTFDLVVSFLSLPFVKEAADELGTGGRGLAQWFRNQCDVWEKQGRQPGDIERALFALLTYTGTGKLRRGWCATIVAAVAGRWSPNQRDYSTVDDAAYFQQAARKAVAAVRAGCEIETLPPVQQDAARCVLRWLQDTGRISDMERRALREAKAREAKARDVPGVTSEGRAM